MDSLEKMNILITGGGGFLGYHIVKGLINYGINNVFVLEHSTFNPERLSALYKNITIIYIDKKDNNSIIEDYCIDIVIHIATFYGRDGVDINNIIETNITLPLSLLYSAKSTNRKITYINTDTFFNNGEFKYNYLGDYTFSKMVAHDWLKLRAGKIQLINMKLEHVYGPYDKENKFIPSIISDLKSNKEIVELTKGDQLTDFIYVEDVATAFITILQNLNLLSKGYSFFEVGTGITTSVRELVEKIHLLIQSKSILKFGAIKGRENEIQFSKANNQDLKNLGWKPKTSLIEGLKATINV